ncbi:MAG TPA: tetratricopeptide repeat protein, partial [Candidatus Paceibacterota bacterium]|nr:tetratricopeptide repeat protein [Candidatus Paceibacterota bacterium]
MSLIPRLFTLIGSAKSFQTTVRQAKESVATVRTLTRDAQAAVVQNDWDKACQGDPVAQNEMGERLAEGRGVPRDWESAVAWFQRSAAQGYPVAQCNLGMMLFLGRG